MKLLFSYNFPRFKPKGDVLQFLIMLRALERKMARVFTERQEHFQLDCVLPFAFQNGQDGFEFRHVRFIEAEQLPPAIAELDKKENYDYIFIRCRGDSQDALDLLQEYPQAAAKLLVLILHYDQNDPDNMRDVIRIFEQCRMVFLQTRPWAERLAAYLLVSGFNRQTIDEKLQVLPQYIESYSMTEPPPAMLNPPHLVQTGVLRSRYGLPVAIEAVKLIRQLHPQVVLHLAYPSIADDILDPAKSLLQAPEVNNHGMLSMWETKNLILQAGIGLALIYDNTANRNPTYSYLTRILEYASLGVPVITTKTVGNVHLLGENYPLYVQDEHDIFACYQKLAQPEFYQEMSRFIRSVGLKYESETAIEDFWSVLQDASARGEFSSIEIIPIPGGRGENKYRVVNPTSYELIGKGAHGAVFKLNEFQCVKIYGKPSILAKEAHALTLAKDFDFIPKVYEVGSNYIVMEYVEGPDLKGFIKKKGILSAELTEQIIMIVKELRRSGFTRINLHLRHLIVTPNGRIKIIDHVNSLEYEEPYPVDLFKGLKKLNQLESFLEQVKQIDAEIYAEWRGHVKNIR